MLHFAIVAIIFFVLGLAWGAGIKEITKEKRRIRNLTHLEKYDPLKIPPPLTHSTQIGGDHYRSKTIQPWDAMEEWMSPEQFKGFLRGNAIKYLARCDDKGGMEDIKKAGHYIAKMLKVRLK